MSERELVKSKPEPRSPHAARSFSRREDEAVPASVLDVVGTKGQPLDYASRKLMEPRFGHDFSRVRVHTDARAAESARDVHARAYTVGPHVVFGAGQFTPDTSRGNHLLAHELAHVVQQRDVPDARVSRDLQPGRAGDGLERDAERQAANVASGNPVTQGAPLRQPRLQRSFIGDVFKLDVGPFYALARAFGAENYTDHELLKYLEKVTTDKQIEDNYDSDNKARAVVKKWIAKTAGFDLKPPQKILLIKEMQSGFTSKADEHGILTILHNSPFPELQEIFGAGGIDPKGLNSDFGGKARDELHAFYDQTFEGGAKAVLSGKKELSLHVKGPYDSTEFQALIQQRIRRIEAAVNGAAKDDRGQVSGDLARKSSDEIYAELKALAPAEQEQALQDMAKERAKQDTVLSDVGFKQGDSALDASAKESLDKRASTLTAAILMLDLTVEALAKDVAIASPKGANAAADRKAFEKTTTPLTPDQAKAAQAAIKPLTKEQVTTEITGVAPAPDAAKFVQKLPGEKVSYDDKIRARAPVMIDEKYARFGAPRSEKVHSDPAQTHQLSELETIANASKDETDHVFGGFKTAKAFTADKFNAAGVLKKPGNIHDAWQSEQAKLKADATYQAGSAEFWMFYLLENDTDSPDDKQVPVKQIEYKHNASPGLDDKTKNPLNDEAKVIAEVGKKYAKSDSKRLFEIGRGWDAFNTSGEVSVQLFKKPDANEDRAFLWDMFFTLIHEYLHTLAAKEYNTYANKLGGESTDEGNTLIEGVDSLLTETVWTSAKPRASQLKIRQAVEPDAVKAGADFDASLLPETPWRRYSSYPNAVKLASVVGIRNLYAAYFYGDVKLIGGK